MGDWQPSSCCSTSSKSATFPQPGICSLSVLLLESLKCRMRQFPRWPFPPLVQVALLAESLLSGLCFETWKTCSLYLILGAVPIFEVFIQLSIGSHSSALNAKWADYWDGAFRRWCRSTMLEHRRIFQEEHVARCSYFFFFRNVWFLVVESIHYFVMFLMPFGIAVGILSWRTWDILISFRGALSEVPKFLGPVFGNLFLAMPAGILQLSCSS